MFVVAEDQCDLGSLMVVVVVVFVVPVWPDVPDTPEVSEAAEGELDEGDAESGWATETEATDSMGEFEGGARGMLPPPISERHKIGTAPLSMNVVVRLGTALVSLGNSRCTRHHSSGKT